MPVPGENPSLPSEDDEEVFDPFDPEVVFAPQQKAVPPVLGRYDKDTGERLMHYSDDVIQSAEKKDDFDWDDDEGNSIDIGF